MNNTHGHLYPSVYPGKRTSLAVAVVLLLALGFAGGVHGAERYFQIGGYHLGATPEELGVVVESDQDLEEKYYEVETGGVRLFFVRIEDRLRAYRIVREENVTQGGIRPILQKLKSQYGTPDRQDIKTTNVRPQNQKKYKTTVKNRATWEISASQEFIAEVESNRIVFELIDHNPEQIKVIKKPDFFEDEEFTVEEWHPDY